ncbi:hypothetical protein NCLIV_035970 [Neospora caninum Liverpool]|uniref:Uncharacterized protein n=1 Tax=Neospora caninum (strain Liverpool) TaxID=572307 RepID=F0VJA5_NEOCL|nr:hypothetical protein NCLIV_035970 [Neospora caninum Liverpool]CBZ53816.1 hypothetical protein NCLIV_035970 [Neospora caninum Liverpool]|eukprot:XP_003883848.1 hypothetical protein NCLIV_035970 [Neospora caninum Liverpool]
MQASSGVRISPVPPPLGPGSALPSCSSFASASHRPAVPLPSRGGSPYKSAAVGSFLGSFLPSAPVTSRNALRVAASSAQSNDRYGVGDDAPSPAVILSVPQTGALSHGSASQHGLYLPPLTLSAASPRLARARVSPAAFGPRAEETVARAPPGSVASTPHTVPTTVSSAPPVSAASATQSASPPVASFPAMFASPSVSPSFLPSLPASLAFSHAPFAPSPPAKASLLAPNAVGSVSVLPVPIHGDTTGEVPARRRAPGWEEEAFHTAPGGEVDRLLPARACREQDDGAPAPQENHPLRKAWLGWRCLCYAEPPPGTTPFERASVNEEISHMVGFGAETSLLSEESDATEAEEDGTSEEADVARLDSEQRKRPRWRAGDGARGTKHPKRSRTKRELWAVRTGGERLGRDLVLTQQTGGPFEKEVLEFLGQQHADRNACLCMVLSMPSMRHFAENLRLDDLERALQSRLSACEARKCKLKVLCEKARKERAMVRQEREELKEKERQFEGSASQEQPREAPSHRTSI